MKPDIGFRWQGQSVWGSRPGGNHAVSRLAQVSASWDDQIPIKPGHGIGQAHAARQRAPEIMRFDATPFREATAQSEHERFAAGSEPIPPAPHGASVEARTPTAAMQ